MALENRSKAEGATLVVWDRQVPALPTLNWCDALENPAEPFALKALNVCDDTLIFIALCHSSAA